MIKISPIPNVDINIFSQILNLGFDAVRFNFSHIKNDVAQEYFEHIKNNHPGVQIIQDLQGHKIRIGKLKKETVVKKYTKFIIGPDGFQSDKYMDLTHIPLKFENYELLDGTYRFILENKENMSIISVLGKIEEDNTFAFLCISDSEVVFRAEKGITAIGFDRTKLKLSQKDKEDVKWGIANEADVIIYSFTSDAAQILELKEYIKSFGDYMPKIWAKIENIEGVNNIESILDVCDGIMIGRGDMCVEIPILKIPAIHDKLITACKNKNKECIIATHLFENYKKKRNPDISDVMAIHYFNKMGATGYMLANELMFCGYAPKLAKSFIEIVENI